MNDLLDTGAKRAAAVAAAILVAVGAGYSMGSSSAGPEYVPVEVTPGVCAEALDLNADGWEAILDGGWYAFQAWYDAYGDEFAALRDACWASLGDAPAPGGES